MGARVVEVELVSQFRCMGSNKSLEWVASTDSLSTDISATRDPVLRRSPGHFDDYVRNIYRVLLSRGMKGCYVYFVDKEVEGCFRGRIYTA